MLHAVREQYETFPDPSPRTEPIGPGQLDRLDDNLHFGWSWHRYHYCYRKSEGLRILDAGCGTGLTSLGLARLNPGATVLGVDFSPTSLDLARRRAEAAGLAGVAFREHDLHQPLPGDLGPFDFIVCRRVLGQVDDPARVLENLARVLDRRGLLLVTLPSELGHQIARQMRRAVAALCPAGAGLAERAEVGLELFRALRPDHPIRQHARARHGPQPPDVDRIVADYLNEQERVFVLEEAVALLERAGLRFLYAETGWFWQADRVFVAEVPERLKARVAALSDASRAVLIDALDTTPRADEYRIYACPAAFDPRTPVLARPEGDGAGGLRSPDPPPDRPGRAPGALRPHPGRPRRRVSGRHRGRGDARPPRRRPAPGRRRPPLLRPDRPAARRADRRRRGAGPARRPGSLWPIRGLLLLEPPDPRQSRRLPVPGPDRRPARLPVPPPLGPAVRPAPLLLDRSDRAGRHRPAGPGAHPEGRWISSRLSPVPSARITRPRR